MGLISRITPQDQLEAALIGLVDDLLAKSGSVLNTTLRGLRELSLEGFEQKLRRSEEIYLKELLSTEDVEEGVRAFLEKRKANWTHR
jgi:cyclohexa-1,5-dienecarbonyl-CoA hydratase